MYKVNRGHRGRGKKDKREKRFRMKNSHRQDCESPHNHTELPFHLTSIIQSDLVFM